VFQVRDASQTSGGTTPRGWIGRGEKWGWGGFVESLLGAKKPTRGKPKNRNRNHLGKCLPDAVKKSEERETKPDLRMLH